MVGGSRTLSFVNCQFDTLPFPISGVVIETIGCFVPSSAALLPPCVVSVIPVATRSMTPLPTRSVSPVPTRSQTPLPTGSLSPFPTESASPLPTMSDPFADSQGFVDRSELKRSGNLLTTNDFSDSSFHMSFASYQSHHLQDTELVDVSKRYKESMMAILTASWRISRLFPGSDSWLPTIELGRTVSLFSSELHERLSIRKPYVNHRCPRDDDKVRQIWEGLMHVQLRRNKLVRSAQENAETN
jgi:hypothetical protein